LGSIPVILQTSDLIIGGAHVPLTSGPANPTENPTVNPTAHPTANPTISPASTTSLIAQLTDGTSTTSVTFVPTSYSAYSDLSTTLTTQTTDSGHHTVPIVIGPHGRGWVCILCAGGGGGSFHWPGPIPFPKFAPPCIGNCGAAAAAVREIRATPLLINVQPQMSNVRPRRQQAIVVYSALRQDRHRLATLRSVTVL
jgi:hypothetical protein